MEVPTFLIGRQPVFNRRLEVYGYELLYRPTSENFVNVVDGDRATLSVFLNTFSQAGLNSVVGAGKAFVNVTRNFLLGRYPIPLPPERTVLEVLEGTRIDAEMLAALKDLAAQGYRIALDDLTSIEEVYPLIGMAHFAKVDIAAVDPLALPLLVNELRQRGVTLVAEKVETVGEYQKCRHLGFEYFQGFFFCRPEIVQGRKFNSSRQVLLQTMAVLQDPNVRIEDLERIISLDVILGYKLLKLVNSGYYAFVLQIRSIRHAIAMIGLNQLKSWLSLLMMAKSDDKPHELSTVALGRARICEELARASGSSNTGAYFLAGLFSVLDAMLDMAMVDVVKEISLSKEITGALLNYEGTVGEMLYAVLEMERGNWDPILGLGVDAQQLNTIYLDTIQWTERLKQEIF